MVRAETSDALVLEFFHRAKCLGELRRAEDEIAKKQWQEACRFAYRGLNADERELVRTFVVQRDVSHLLLGSFLWTRGQILSEAYWAVGQRAFTGHVNRACGWKWKPYSPIINDGHSRYLARMEACVREGMRRWLDRDLETPVLEVWVTEAQTRTEMYRHYAFMSVDPFWLRHVALRGLHAPPPSSQVYPVMARAGQRLMGGVWLAEARWIHRRKRGESTYGWIAWCYEPGSRGTATKPPVVELLVQGRTADGALQRFWKVYRARHGQSDTPADRDLRHAQLAHITPDLADLPGPEEAMSDEDLDALAGLMD